MKTLSKVNLPDMVADSILDYILDQDLKPGDCIPTEKEICVILGIGKTSVREGITKLKAAGLLESTQGGRIYVREINLESLLRPENSIPLYRFLKMSAKEELDLIATRRIIETAAIKEAARRINTETLKTLMDHCRSMSESLNDVTRFIPHDRAFHREIVVASGNTILPIVFETISDLYSRQFWEVSHLPHALERALEFHKKILTALERGSSDEAVELLNMYLSDMEVRLNRSEETGGVIDPMAKPKN